MYNAFLLSFIKGVFIMLKIFNNRIEPWANMTPPRHCNKNKGGK